MFWLSLKLAGVSTFPMPSNVPVPLTGHSLVFLQQPISRRDGQELVQYAGRLHQLHPGKHELSIVDYVDSTVPILPRMFGKRHVGYRAMGYRVSDNGTLTE
jgi:hypothetical protein